MYYQFNTETKEYITPKYGQTLLTDDNWELVHADYKGWVPWIPGPNAKSPVKNESGYGYAQMELRDGDIVDSVYHWDNKPDFSRQVVAYRPILDNEEQDMPEWNGQNIPPVGTVCEYQNNECCEWRDIQITAIGKERILYWDFEEDLESTLLIKAAGNFRPVRSHRDKVVGEMIKVLEKTPGVISTNDARRKNAQSIYEAIKNGKIPGIKTVKDN